MFSNSYLATRYLQPATYNWLLATHYLQLASSNSQLRLLTDFFEADAKLNHGFLTEMYTLLLQLLDWDQTAHILLYDLDEQLWK